MITAPQAFVLGHAVPVIGIYFRAADLLATATQNQPAPMVARARELLATMDARKPGVIANVRRVEGLLAALPALAGDPPKLPNDFDPWSARVLAAVESALAGEPALAVVHLVGRLTGDALSVLNTAAYELVLDASAPGQQWLADRLRTARAEVRRLGTALRPHAGIVPNDGAALSEFADELDGAPLTDLAATQAAMKRCAERVGRLERAFGATPAGN